MQSLPWAEHFGITPDELDILKRKLRQDEDPLFACLISGRIVEAEFFAWATEFYQLPCVRSDFFSAPPDVVFWESVKGNFPWHPGVIPLAHWEDTIYIGCVLPPEFFPHGIKHQFVIAPAHELMKVWRTYNPQSDAFAITPDALERIINPYTGIKLSEPQQVIGGMTISELTSSSVKILPLPQADLPNPVPSLNMTPPPLPPLPEQRSQIVQLPKIEFADTPLPPIPVMPAQATASHAVPFPMPPVPPPPAMPGPLSNPNMPDFNEKLIPPKPEPTLEQVQSEDTRIEPQTSAGSNSEMPDGFSFASFQTPGGDNDKSIDPPEMPVENREVPADDMPEGMTVSFGTSSNVSVPSPQFKPWEPPKEPIAPEKPGSDEFQMPDGFFKGDRSGNTLEDAEQPGFETRLSNILIQKLEKEEGSIRIDLPDAPQIAVAAKPLTPPPLPVLTTMQTPPPAPQPVSAKAEVKLPPIPMANAYVPPPLPKAQASAPAMAVSTPSPMPAVPEVAVPAPPPVQSIVAPKTAPVAERGTEVTKTNPTGVMDFEDLKQLRQTTKAKPIHQIDLPDVDPVPMPVVERNRFDGSKNYEDLGTQVVQEILKTFDHGLVFLFKKGELRPWKWSELLLSVKGSNPDPIDTTTPSIFRIAIRTCLPYHGYVMPSAVNTKFFNEFHRGIIPKHVTVMPILIEGKVAGMIMGLSDGAVSIHGTYKAAENIASDFTRNLERMRQMKAAVA